MSAKPQRERQRGKRNRAQAPPAEHKPAEKAQPSPVPEEKDLFSHLHVLRKWSTPELLEELTKTKGKDLRYVTEIHPDLVEYALDTAQDTRVDEDTRAIRFLQMFINVLRDAPEVPGRSFRRTVLDSVNLCMDYLKPIRINHVGVGNCVRIIKSFITNLENVKEEEANKERIIEIISQFMEEKIVDASAYIVKACGQMIHENDVVLTYGHSEKVVAVLNEASKNNVHFKVVVVDSRPNYDSKEMLSKLNGVDIRYVFVSGLSYVMPDVTKVLIEPCGILSNNAALTNAGTAMVAMVAHEFGVPVIFACNSYRFASTVRIDALSQNEVLSSEFISSRPENIEAFESRYLSLLYDVTPGIYVDIVVSELGSLPINSVSTNIRFIQDSYTLDTKRRFRISK